MNKEGPIVLGPAELTPEYAARVVYLSFKYSQGSTNVQRQIYDYLHLIQPKWRLPHGDFFDQLMVSAQRSATKFVRSGHIYPPKRPDAPIYHDSVLAGSREIHQTLADQAKLMRACLAGDDNWLIRQWQTLTAKTQREKQIKDLTFGVAYSDHYFLVEKSGRVRRHTSQSTPIGDPWSSHLIDYGLKSHKTGLAEYDQIFSDIKSYLIRPGRIDRQVQSLLPKLTMVYNQHHSEAPCPFDFSYTI